METTTKQRIDWLLAHNLPPLPVAPKQDARKYPKINKATAKMGEHSPLDKDRNPIPRFTGKNPSFLDKKGNAETVNHGNFQTKLPTKNLLSKWFTNPDTGIGTLGGIPYKDGKIIWIDLDKKQFSCEQEFTLAIGYIEDQLGTDLQNCLIENTHSGGRRWGIAVRQAPDFTNFCLEPGGFHAGELLGAGRFTVLAPTIGPSGNAYETLHLPKELGVIDSIDWLYPISQPVADKPKPERRERPKPSEINPLDVLPLTVSLEQCLSRPAKAVLSGEDYKGDESFSLSNFVKESYGWENWLNYQGISFTGSAESLTYEAGSSLGHDDEKTARVIKSCKDLGQYQPSCWFSGGDESCWKVIKRVNKKTWAHFYVQPASPTSREQSGDRPVKPSEKTVEVKTSQPLKEARRETARIYGGSKDLKTHELMDFVESNIAQYLEFDELRSEMILEGKKLTMGTDCKIWFLRKYGESAGKEDIYDCFVNYAKDNSFNPVQRYLEAVAAKPERVRIDNLAERYFGRSEPIYNRMVEMWLISAVARALNKGTENNPGVQVDHTLILQSSQGKYKSTWFKVLGGAWFSDSVKDIESKDSLMIVHSNWIIELSELDRITSRKQAGAIKHWLTQKTDSYRKPYAREIEPNLPRPCVFCGTVNPSRFLVDDENRRFWIIPVSEALTEINIPMVTAERDAIWAAAYIAYHWGGIRPLLTLLFKAGAKPSPLWTLLMMMNPIQPWWPNEKEKGAIALINENFKDIDAWQEPIEEWIAHKEFVSAYEILTELFKIEPGQIKRTDDMRVGKILNSLGWTKESRRHYTDSDGQKVFRKVKLNPAMSNSVGKVGKVGKTQSTQEPHHYLPQEQVGNRSVKEDFTYLPTSTTHLVDSEAQSQQEVYIPTDLYIQIPNSSPGWAEKNGHELKSGHWVWVAPYGACELLHPHASGWSVWARDYEGGINVSVPHEKITHIYEG